MSLISIGSILSTARENLAHPRRPPKTKNRIPAAATTARIFHGIIFKTSGHDIDTPPGRLVSPRNQIEPRAGEHLVPDHCAKPI